MGIRSFCLGLLTAALLGLAGCGDDDDSGAGSSEGVLSCEAHCDAQQACAVTPVDDCKQGCGLVIGQLDADCAAKAKAAFDCNVANDEACGPVVTCAEQADAYAACLRAGG